MKSFILTPAIVSKRLAGGRPTSIVGYPTNAGYPTFVGWNICHQVASGSKQSLNSEELTHNGCHDRPLDRRVTWVKLRVVGEIYPTIEG